MLNRQIDIIRGGIISLYRRLLAFCARMWAITGNPGDQGCGPPGDGMARGLSRNEGAAEPAAAADAVGFAAVAITGILCGLAGAYMATALQAGFGREMTAGRGYIALAALIFAKWRPVAALWACLLFGFFQALALRPDVVEAVVQVKVPVPFLDALPYVLTVLVLAGFVGKAIPPRAGGESYVKER